MHIFVAINFINGIYGLRRCGPLYGIWPYGQTILKRQFSCSCPWVSCVEWLFSWNTDEYLYVWWSAVCLEIGIFIPFFYMIKAISLLDLLSGFVAEEIFMYESLFVGQLVKRNIVV